MKRPDYPWLVVIAQLVTLTIALAAVHFGASRRLVFDAWGLAQVVCLSIVGRALWRSL